MVLSQIPFGNFYDEIELGLIQDRGLFILALLDSKKNLGTTQIHKLSFLVFVEGKIMVPFKFAKWPHGPFSNELKEMLEKFEKERIIKRKRTKIFSFDKNSTSISEKGEKILKKRDKEIKEIKKFIEKIIKNHDEGAISLERYCYDNYFLRPEREDKEKWSESIKNKIKDLLLILNSRIKEVRDIEELEEEKRAIILTSFNYIENLFQKLFSSGNIDEVVKGVLIKSMEEYLKMWGELLSLIKKPTKTKEINKLLLGIRVNFRFINEVAERYGVFESIFIS